MRGAAQRAWRVFALCAAVLMVAVAALSVQIVRSEHAQVETEIQARLEAQVRLALWRLDSRVTPLIASESARDHESFVAPRPGALSPDIKLRFALRDGTFISSPDASPEVRERFSEQITLEALESAIPRPAGDSAETLALVPTVPNDDLANGDLQRPEQGYSGLQNIQQAAPVEQQQAISDNEYRQRKARLDFNTSNYANSVDADFEQDQGWLSRGLGSSNRRRQVDDAIAKVDLAGRPEPLVRESVTTALWVGEQLLLARRARALDGEWLEGSWVDWTHLQSQLLREVTDLLPEARLLPVREAEQGDTTRMLATLPLRLDPGVEIESLVEAAASTTTPIALGLVWLIVLMVLGATAWLLRATLDLSERRGAFVSAVTHELRTPLTTFRMYTEMLSEDMVTDEAQRARYIETLRKEAHRLDNLVENVLTYARIEDERAQARVESHELGELVESIAPRLRERAERADFEFAHEVPTELDSQVVELDRTALEQVLFNLVDNAAKYGRGDARARIELSVSQPEARQLLFRVRDWGPGIPTGELDKVFRPFEKAEAHEAGTLPGVGLGLALCQRLASALGGELSYRDARPGAAFELRLTR